MDFVEGWRRSEKSEEFSGGVDSPCSVCSACTENSYGGCIRRVRHVHVYREIAMGEGFPRVHRVHVYRE